VSKKKKKRITDYQNIEKICWEAFVKFSSLNDENYMFYKTNKIKKTFKFYNSL